MPISVSSFTFHLRGVMQHIFPGLRDHYYPCLKPEPLKAVADKYLWAALRVCNLAKHADGVMSHVPVTPGGARISINPNRPSLTPSPCPATGRSCPHYVSPQGYRNSSDQEWLSSIHVCLNIYSRALNSLYDSWEKHFWYYYTIMSHVLQLGFKSIQKIS